jgi:hypothetical protein
MQLHPLPADSHMRWRRLDGAGYEQARIERITAGWRLRGELELVEVGERARLRYAIECDPAWLTLAARVEGEVGSRPLRFALAADAQGHWTCNGAAAPELDGALDLDLAFTPATNLLPIRRLALSVGASASVRSAWLRFPQLRLEPLEQSYTRASERAFRYRAMVDGEEFSALLEVDACGRVLRYEGLWEAESAASPRPER